MKVTTLGLDLAKSVFTLPGVDEHGHAVLRKTVRRGKLLELCAQLPACVVGMEACSGAQHWARERRKRGHQPRLMAAELVEPYRQGGKNDANDAHQGQRPEPPRRTQRPNIEMQSRPTCRQPRSLHSTGRPYSLVRPRYQRSERRSTEWEWASRPRANHQGETR
jgi:transposase